MARRRKGKCRAAIAKQEKARRKRKAESTGWLEKERKRARLAMAAGRKLKGKLAVNRVDDKLRKRRSRSRPSLRELERRRDSLYRRTSAQNPQVQRNRQFANTHNRSLARKIPARRKRDAAKAAVGMAKNRAQEHWRRRERMQNTTRRRASRRIAALCSHPLAMAMDEDASNDSGSEICENLDNSSECLEDKCRYTKLVNQFNKVMKGSPSYICSCCGGLWYMESLHQLTQEELLKLDKRLEWTDKSLVECVCCVPTEALERAWSIHPFLTGKAKEGPQQWKDQHLFCSTCLASIKKREVPRLALSNGLAFDKIPDSLKDLSQLEERLVAPRLPFMQIRPLGAERQLQLRGNVVNVENNLDVCAKVIPRKFNDTSVVQVELMRNMRYQHPYMCANVRPLKVYKAAKELLQSELYKEHGIKECDDWKRYSDDQEITFVSSMEDLPQRSDTDGGVIDKTAFSDALFDHPEDFYTADHVRNNSTSIRSRPSAGGDEDGVSESDDDNEPDSLLQIPSDETLVFNENTEAHGVRLAPAQRNQPKPMYLDPDAERLSFPSIYCGKKQRLRRGVKFTYTDITKSELRRYDRRAAKPWKILYSFKRSHNEKIRNAVRVMLRRRVGGITKRQAMDGTYTDRLIKKDEGYTIFSNVRASPAYWQHKKKEVISMVRQLGTPTFFITLSAAETRWEELLIMLKAILDGEKVTEQEAREFTFEDKARLIKSDPVTCVRHFDHKFRALLNILLKREHGVFAPYKLMDHMSRIEYQKRGSPHSHGLYWLENAPAYDHTKPETEEECIKWIDQFITCNRFKPNLPCTSSQAAAANDDPSEIVTYQLHKHRFTCKRKEGVGGKCRFGFPRPPLDCTMILTPLPKDTLKEERKAVESNYKLIRTKLEGPDNKRPFEDDIPFPQFLEELGLSREEYISAIRGSIQRTTVFLKRNTNAAFINNYNFKILEAWRANMDIQYVVDGFATAAYCLSYMLKSDGGISAAMRKLSRQIQRGNFTAKDRMKQFAGTLIKSSEICAQETAAFLLGQPCTHTSRDVVFVNTSPPDKRARMLLPKDQLERLTDACIRVYQKDLITYYKKRPANLEDVCLADFACKYESRSSTNQIAINDEVPIQCEEQDDDEGPSENLPIQPGRNYQGE